MSSDRRRALEEWKRKKALKEKEAKLKETPKTASSRRVRPSSVSRSQLSSFADAAQDADSTPMQFSSFAQPATAMATRRKTPSGTQQRRRAPQSGSTSNARANLSSASNTAGATVETSSTSRPTSSSRRRTSAMPSYLMPTKSSQQRERHQTVRDRDPQADDFTTPAAAVAITSSTPMGASTSSHAHSTASSQRTMTQRPSSSGNGNDVAMNADDEKNDPKESSVQRRAEHRQLPEEGASTPLSAHAPIPHNRQARQSILKTPRSSVNSENRPQRSTVTGRRSSKTPSSSASTRSQRQSHMSTRAAHPPSSSSSRVRQKTALPSFSASSASNSLSDIADEISAMNALLLQWEYINLKFCASVHEQQQYAESSLYAMWETVASLRREVADLESSCESLRFATAERALLHRMDNQTQVFDDTLSLLETKLEDLAQCVYSTAHHQPLDKGVTMDPTALAKHIDGISSTIQTLVDEELSLEQKKRLFDLSLNLQRLEGAVADHRRDLRFYEAQTRKLSDIELEERSLVVHMLEAESAAAI